MIDIKQSVIELARWYILVTLNAGRPTGVSEELIERVLSDTQYRLTAHELRRELAYLRDRSLITLRGEDDDRWVADLTAMGVDVLEYTVPCKPGIARPPKRGGA